MCKNKTDIEYFKLIYSNNYSQRSIRVTFDRIFLKEVVDEFKSFLLAVGYHQSNVDRIIFSDADELVEEE